MFIVKKKISGKDYYYLRRSERRDGKVRAVTVAYLGKTRKEAERKKREIEKNKGQKMVKIKKEKNNEIIMDSNLKECENNFGKESKEFTSFVQEAGFIWGPSPEIYGGVAGFYTYGPLGKLLKNKVEASVRKVFNTEGYRELEGPTVLPDKVWKASGHLETFKDRTIKCKKCEGVFRADKIIEENFDVSADAWSDERILKFIKDKGLKCPSCKGDFEMKISTQSLMMKTKVAGQESSLRPETATVTYLPFLRNYNYFRKKLPFGVFQIGKAYRNEISPRQGVLRGREFTQAEGQIFIDPLKKDEWEKFEEIKGKKVFIWSAEDQAGERGGGVLSIGDMFEKKLIKSKAYAWCLWLAYSQFVGFGIPDARIRLRQHLEDEKAFYADDAWDIEIKLNNYGWVEFCGVHDRTDYDLKQHSKASGEKLESVREDGTKFVPHVLEIAFGTDRSTYALLDLFYDKKEESKGKSMFKVPYQMAPIDVSVFPLMKKPELLTLSKKVKGLLDGDFIVDYDISGSIGKRYLRSAVAGTPYAVTIDYDSLKDEDVTIRDRDSEKQIRVKIKDLKMVFRELFDGKKLEDF